MFGFTWSTRLVRWIAGGILLLAVTVVGGCSCPNLRGEGFGEDEGTAMRRMRPVDKEVTPWGFSNKARDIEHNLGAK